ncbi:MAG TPA: ACP S-malonyltransferase [Acidimicrobiales bacterium]|nr:ACP S-malonyltransferase [Acidimicrobiales bacterium]
MAVAVMFPGQGSQQPGWGTRWKEDPAWSVVERAEAALDRPLADLLLDSEATLDRTEDAQLSVLLGSLVVWEALGSSLPKPVGFAGHSLGQITALLAAGALPFDDGIRLAARRARHTQEAADRHPGRMAALLGATLEQADEACRAAPDACWLANDNAPGQVVVAGTPDGVEAAVEKARETGVRRATVLPVGGAFHTPLMEEARAAFLEDLEDVEFSEPAAPIVSNGDARAYSGADGWPEKLADHLVRPVRWRESVETLVASGAGELIEVGPGTTLAGLARRIAPDATVQSLERRYEEAGV